MKTQPRRNWFRQICCLTSGVVLASLTCSSSFAADESAVLAALRAADDERVAATRAADRARLEACYSDDLHYSHSNGKVDRKASQIQGILSGGTAYETFDYKERTFVPLAPGVALMKGRVLVHLRRSSGQKDTMDLSYLAVWREEQGRWRFLAWQSCRNTVAIAQK